MNRITTYVPIRAGASSTVEHDRALDVCLSLYDVFQSRLALLGIAGGRDE